MIKTAKTSSAAVTTTATITSTKTVQKRRANPVISPFPLRPVAVDEHKYVKLISWNVASLNSVISKGSLPHYIRYRPPASPRREPIIGTHLDTFPAM